MSRQKVLFPTIHLVLVVFFLVGCSTPADIPTAVVFVGTTPSVVPPADTSEESAVTTSTPGPTVTATVGPGEASCDANSPPIADAGGPYNAMMGKGYAVVIFDASNSTDSDGTIETYEWDFGDNSASDSGQSVSHAYSSTGIFEAKLTVRDNCGATSQDTAEVTIVAPASTCGPPSGWVIYVVRRGDNLFRLSLNTQTTVAQVKQANCLVGDVIKVGQQLYLPFIPGVPTSPTATVTPVMSVSPTPTLTETPVTPTSTPTETPVTPTPTPTETPVTPTPTPTETPVTPTPTPFVMLMDGDHQAIVYNPETYEAGKTNADDIADILENLPIDTCKEKTSVEWQWDSRDCRQDPELIIIHTSAFYDPDIYWSDKLSSFLENRTEADTQTKFLIYSRARQWAGREDAVKSEYEARYSLHGRIDVLHVPGRWHIEDVDQRLEDKVVELILGLN